MKIDFDRSYFFEPFLFIHWKEVLPMCFRLQTEAKIWHFLVKSEKWQQNKGLSIKSITKTAIVVCKLQKIYGVIYLKVVLLIQYKKWKKILTADKKKYTSGNTFCWKSLDEIQTLAWKKDWVRCSAIYS